MIFGEARQSDVSEIERIAIGYTAINRANDGKKFNGETIREAILKHRVNDKGEIFFQYSCFNYGDPNRKQLMDPQKYDSRSFEKCLAIAEKILSGNEKYPAHGATHYYNPDEVKKKPSWADKIKKIGRIKVSENRLSKHEFYREE